MSPLLQPRQAFYLMHPTTVAELTGRLNAAFALISMASFLWLSTAGVTDPQ